MTNDNSKIISLNGYHHESRDEVMVVLATNKLLKSG